MKKKDFDCVEFQHQAGQRLAQRTSGMTPEQEAAYWKTRAKEFRAQDRAAKAKRKTG